MFGNFSERFYEYGSELVKARKSPSFLSWHSGFRLAVHLHTLQG